VASLPESVYEFGAWLKAHPWVKRVKLDTATFERYVSHMEADARLLPESGYPVEFFTWRSRVAAITDHAWPHRREIWPERCYRGKSA
jgi:hypothetical protein